MPKTRAIMAIQCDYPGEGRRGCFLFTRNPDGTRNPVTPRYVDLVAAYRAIAGDGWRPLPYNSAEPTGEFEKD